MGVAVADILRPLGLAPAVARPKAGRKAKKAGGGRKTRTGPGLMVQLRKAGTGMMLTAALLAASLVLVAGYQFLLHGPVLALNRITISGLDRLTSSQVIRLAGLSQGVSLLKLNPEAIRTRLEASPWVASARVRRVLPDELSIGIVERKPVAVALSRGRWMMDGQGRRIIRLKPGQKADLPLVTGLTNSGRRADGWRPLAYAGQVIAELDRGQGPVSLKQVSELAIDRHKGLIVHTRRGGPSLILGRRDPGEGLAALERVSRELKSKGLWAKAAYIDLRFRERVYVGFKTG